MWFGSDLVFGGFPEDILDFELENLIVLLDGWMDKWVGRWVGR